MVFLALHYADFWGNRRPFPSKVKNNFSRIDISQPTPSLSLSVLIFSLAASYSTARSSINLETFRGFRPWNEALSAGVFLASKRSVPSTRNFILKADEGWEEK